MALVMLRTPDLLLPSMITTISINTRLTLCQAEVGTLLEGKGFGAENLGRLCPEPNGPALWGGKGERCVRDQEVHGSGRSGDDH